MIFGNRGQVHICVTGIPPLESPLPAWHSTPDPTSPVPLVCPSTTGLKYILPHHLVVFRDASLCIVRFRFVPALPTCIVPSNL